MKGLCEMNKEKQKFIEPKIEIIRIRTEDIITTSSETNQNDDSGINLPIDPFIIT